GGRPPVMEAPLIGSAVTLGWVINSVAPSPDCFNGSATGDGEIVVSKFCAGGGGEIVVSKFCAGGGGEVVGSECSAGGGGEIVVSKFCAGGGGEIAVSKSCDETGADGAGVWTASGATVRPIIDVSIRCDSPLLVNRIVSGSDANAFSYSRASSRVV